MDISLLNFKIRRIYVIATLVVLATFTGWHMAFSALSNDQATLVSSLDPHLVLSLDPKLLPDEKIRAESDPNRKRLIFIGDIHGCKDEVEKLLKKISFDADHGDHLIFTGDIINKGPDSIGVIEIAQKYSASCVRGNHEDRILRLRKQMTEAREDSNSSPEGSNPKEDRDRMLARQLNDEQAEWLKSLPGILNVGRIRGLGQVVVVHAGLVPGVELENQDLSSVMNMRTIDPDTLIPSPKNKGTPWSVVFNKEQSFLFSSLENTIPDPQSRTTCVIYGHDSSTSLNIQTYTKGLDTGCYKGGKLTALVISDGGEQDFIQVQCPDYRR